MTERHDGVGMRGKKRAYNEEDDELLKLMHYGVESVQLNSIVLKDDGIHEENKTIQKTMKQ